MLRSILSLLLLLACSLTAQDRVALVICNGTYPGNPDDPRDLRLRPLPSFAADKEAISTALRTTGFTVEAFENKTVAEMLALIPAFADRHKGKREVLVHLSLHGIREGEENYLTGIDSDLDIRAAKLRLEATLTGDKLAEKLKTLSKDTAESQTVPLRFLLANLQRMTPQNITLDEAQRHVRIVLLDACRNPLQPFDDGPAPIVPKGTTLIKKGGLADIAKIPGLYIAFGAQAGSESLQPKAAPGARPEPSFLTAAWAERMTKPGTIQRVFEDVQKVVYLKTKPLVTGTDILPQKPAAYDDLYLEVPFAFVPDAKLPPRAKTFAEKLVAAPTSELVENDLGMAFAHVPGAPRFCTTETTRGAWRQFIRETKHDMSGGMSVLKIEPDGKDFNWKHDTNASWENPGFPQTDDHPVVGVSYLDAKAFCKWLSDRDGVTYRLPTDAEWSKAVGTAKYPWGASDLPPSGAGNYAGEESKVGMPANWGFISGFKDGEKRTAPVGQFTANRLGIFDLGGNVWEFCEDEYKASMNSAEALEKIPALKNEKASDGTPFRVLRGASWINGDSVALRSSYRYLGHPTYRNGNFGFRVVVVSGR